MFVQWYGFAYKGIGYTFGMPQFFGRNLLKMRKVETERIGGDIRTFLLDMRPKHLTQGVMQQVSGSMVALYLLTALNIYGRSESRLGIGRFVSYISTASPVASSVSLPLSPTCPPISA